MTYQVSGLFLEFFGFSMVIVSVNDLEKIIIE